MMGKHQLKESWDGLDAPAGKRRAPEKPTAKQAEKAAAAPAAHSPLTPEQRNYVQLLKAHDWYYDYSDDHSVWRRGGAERDRLRILQKDLDPTGDIWNEHAPQDFKLSPPEAIKLLQPMKIKKRRDKPAP